MRLSRARTLKHSPEHFLLQFLRKAKWKCLIKINNAIKRAQEQAIATL
jgi:hypothetical protein